MPEDICLLKLLSDQGDTSTSEKSYLLLLLLDIYFEFFINGNKLL